VAKACEPPSVLLALTALAATALAIPAAWSPLSAAFLLAHATLAPLLAAGRAARIVARSAPDRDFARWFPRDPAG
jgi:hypothetical protein